MPGKKPVIGALMALHWRMSFIRMPLCIGLAWRSGTAMRPRWRHGRLVRGARRHQGRHLRFGVRSAVAGEAGASYRHSERGSCVASHPTRWTLRVTPEALVAAAQQPEAAERAAGRVGAGELGVLRRSVGVCGGTGGARTGGANPAANGTAGWQLAGDAGLAAAATAGTGERPDLGRAWLGLRAVTPPPGLPRFRGRGVLRGEVSSRRSGRRPP